MALLSPESTVTYLWSSLPFTLLDLGQQWRNIFLWVLCNEKYNLNTHFVQLIYVKSSEICLPLNHSKLSCLQRQHSSTFIHVLKPH